MEEDIDEGPTTFSGDSALFAINCTADGRPLFESLSFSSCAWAIGQTKTIGPADSKWLSGFDGFVAKQSESIAESWKLPEDDANGQRIAEFGFPIGRPLARQDLVSAAARLLKHLGWKPPGDHFEVRVKSAPVSSKRVYSSDGNDFLNSFLLGDLKRVSEAAASGQNIGSLLGSYLAAANPSTRRDVRQDVALVDRQLAPEAFPRACWPSRKGHPLVLSQQFAVNTLVQQCSPGSGAFAVNGPPGTGKSTLLRDIVAHVVLERAKVLASLPTAAAGIVGKSRLKGGKGPLYVPLWDPRLMGHGMVVASSNNAAVNNITLELPALDAIDDRWHGQTDYFRAFATRLLGHDAWGLIAAKLGNKANRQEFMSRLLFGKSWGDEDDTAQTSPGAPKRPNSLFEYLKSTPAEPSWKSAVTAFKAAFQEEDRIRCKRQVYWQATQDLPKEQAALATAEQTLASLDERIRQHEGRILELQRQRADALRSLEHRRGDHAAHLLHKPAWWEWLLPWNKRPWAWSSAEKQLAESERSASDAVCKADDVLSHEQQQLSRRSAESPKQASVVTACISKLQKTEDCLAEMMQRGINPPIPSDRVEERERSSPWMDAEWHDARAKLFLSALNLHQAFIRENAEPFQRAVRGILMLFTGQVTDKAPDEAIIATWEALFLIVPVISTTFASVDRLFGRLPPRSLGWLLIDEAGQATPQAAVGALWRSQRAVVVGDPLQLEPVVTIPLRLQEILRNHFKVEKEWMPAFTSVQERTDSTCSTGTYLATADGPKWIGSPLRVHRRCDEPMFSVANAIAYDGLMVHGTAEVADLPIPRSCWISVDAMQWDSHWCEEEGEAFYRLVEALLKAGITPKQIFAISPFRRVVRGLKGIAARWNEVQVGTVHTVQGREADVVILVLGGNPSRLGAVQWASQTPNLLNVAITRAKRRFYVIGDRVRWSGVQYFSTMAQKLPAEKR